MKGRSSRLDDVIYAAKKVTQRCVYIYRCSRHEGDTIYYIFKQPKALEALVHFFFKQGPRFSRRL